MTRVIFLGPPGAGKGTQAQIVSQSYHIPHISTGDILRAAVSEGTELGQQAQLFMDKGELVPDALIIMLIKERLSQPDVQAGWILDGFPRNVSQAVFLDELFREINQDYDLVINLEVPTDVLVKRLLSRGRKDDTQPVVEHRLQVYQEQTAPLISFYQERQKLKSIDGNQYPDGVTADLNQVLSA